MTNRIKSRKIFEVPSSTQAIIAPATSGYILTGNGPNSSPTFQPLSSSSDPSPVFFANAATTSALPSVTYLNGVLTATSNGVLPIQDGVSLSIGDILFNKDQVAKLQNGLYEVTDPGSVSTPFILTRPDNYNETSEIYPSQINVLAGVVNGTKYFLEQTVDPIVGVDNIVYSSIATPIFVPFNNASNNVNLNNKKLVNVSRLGVGTASPTAPFQVVSTSGLGSNTMRVDELGATSGAVFGVTADNTGNVSDLIYGRSLSTNTSTRLFRLDGAGNITRFTVFNSGHVLLEGVTSTGATGTGNFVFSNSPTFTSIPLAPTASPGTNTTQLATTAFVTAAISANPSLFTDAGAYTYLTSTTDRLVTGSSTNLDDLVTIPGRHQIVNESTNTAPWLDLYPNTTNPAAWAARFMPDENTYPTIFVRSNNFHIGTNGSTASGVDLFLFGGSPAAVFRASGTNFLSAGPNNYTYTGNGNGSYNIVGVDVSISSQSTTVNNSTSGTTKFNQPFNGAGYKKVMIYCAAALGTASYTFPVAFINTPVIIATNGIASTVITSLSTTAVTVTGATNTGFLILEGY